MSAAHPALPCARRRTIGCLCALATALTAASVRADALSAPDEAARAAETATGKPSSQPRRDGVYLSWVRLQGAEECPDVLRIAEDVSRRLGWNPFQGKPVQYIEAQIRRDHDEGGESWWRVEIYLRDTSSRARGSRTLVSRAPACDTLASVAGLAIAIIIDPDVLTRPAATPEVIAGGGELPIVVRQPGLGRLSAGAIAAMGLLPGVAAGAALSGELGVTPRTSLLLASVFLPEVEHRAAAGEFRFGMSYAQLGICTDATVRSRWALAGCAAVLAGAVHSVVLSPTPTKPGQRLYLAGSAGLRLSVSIGARWEATTSVDVVAPLIRNLFEVDTTVGPVAAYSQPALAGVGQLALVHRFR